MGTNFWSTFAKFFGHSGIELQNGVQVRELPADPTSTATDANLSSFGSFNGNLYVKEDNGSSTNWKLLADDAALQAHISQVTGAHAATAISYDNTTSMLVATQVQAAIDEAYAAGQDHINETSGAHAASAISYDNSTSGLAATETQAAIDEVDGDLDAHIAQATGAHAASAISYDNSTSGLTATETQAAIDEIDGDLDAHIAQATGAHAASAISYDNSTSGLTATETQAAIDEVEARVDTAEADIIVLKDKTNKVRYIETFEENDPAGGIYNESGVTNSVVASTTHLDGTRSAQFDITTGDTGGEIRLNTPISGFAQVELEPLGISLDWEYSGDDDDVSLVVQEATGALIFTDVAEYSLPRATTPEYIDLPFKLDFTSTNYRYIFRINVDNNAARMKWDNIEVRKNPIGLVNSSFRNSIRLSGNSGQFLTANFSPIPFAGSGTGWNGTQYTVQSDGALIPYSMMVSTSGPTAIGIDIYINGVFKETCFYPRSTYLTASPEISGFLDVGETSAGDVIEWRSNTNVTITNTTGRHYLRIREESETLGAISSPQVNDINVTAAGNAGTPLTAGVTLVDFIAVNDPNGDWLGDRFKAPDTGLYTFSGSLAMTSSADRSFNYYINGGGAKRLTEGGLSTQDFSVTLRLTKGQEWSMRCNDAATLNNSTAQHHINITKQTSSSVYSIPVTNKVENVYSAIIDTSENIVSQNSPFITSIVRNAAGNFTVNLISGVFSEPPSVVVSGASASFRTRMEVNSITSTSFNVLNSNETGSLVDPGNWNIVLQRQGADYKAPQGYFLGTMPRTSHITGGTEYKTADTLDGKPIYAKTFDASLANGFVAATGVSKLVRQEGTFVQSGTVSDPIPYNNGVVSRLFRLNPTTNEITLLASATANVAATIYYTKI